MVPATREHPGAYTIVRILVFASMLAGSGVATYYWMHGQAGPKVSSRFQRVAVPGERYHLVRPEWRPRIFATSTARVLGLGEPSRSRHRIALFFALGLCLTGLAYLFVDQRAAPFMLLGTFVSLVYSGSPRAENTWYPWDVPALVLSAAILALAVRRRVIPLAMVVVLAVLFKETLAVAALFFLFYEGRNWRWRATWTGGVLAISGALRLGVESVVGGSYPHQDFLHVHGKPDRPLRLLDNLRYLFETHPNHVLWTNVGLWLTVLIIPTRDPVLKGFKWIVALHYLGVFLAGSFNEFRVFYEVLPGSLLLAHQVFADARDRPRELP